jgi:hypothetical protein
MISLFRLTRWIFPVALCALATASEGQTCLVGSDMDEATRTALTRTAQHDFDLLASGDKAGLKQVSAPSLASDFSGIEAVVQENHASLALVHATAKPPFLLKADKPEAGSNSQSGEFLCGVFGAHGQTADSAEFIIPNLPTGQYGIVMMDAPAKTPVTATFVVQLQNTDWKLAGLYVKNSQVAGHDANWFAQQARAFAAKGQRRNAWLYFLEARDLAVPVQFMTTQLSDKLYDESQAVKPTDLPDNNVVELPTGASKYQMTAIFPTAVEDDVDVVVKYQYPDLSNTMKAFEANQVVTKALLVKYPEFRDAFAGVVARAVEPSGKDYGSLVSMKDIK